MYGGEPNQPEAFSEYVRSLQSIVKEAHKTAWGSFLESPGNFFPDRNQIFKLEYKE